MAKKKKPIRDKKGRFVRWPGGKKNPGGYRKTKMKIGHKAKGNYYKSQGGRVWKHTPDGWKRLASNINTIPQAMKKALKKYRK